MLDQLIPGNLYAFFLVFARVGAVIMLLPGFGEAYVSARIRLLFALVLSLVLLPIVASHLPAMPASPFQLVIHFGIEILIGAFIGGAVRILVSALQMAGTVVAYQTSLANALVYDPASAQQSSLTSTFLATTGVMLIFTTNLHHLMLGGIVESYQLFAVGKSLPVSDMSETAARLLGRAFLLAMQIASPFVVVGLLFTLGVGLVNRLMPQVQVFFVAMPMQIAIGIFVLMLTVSAAMMWFLGAFEAELRTLFTGS
jgi:flagellar biosynthesis protein FliR